MTFATMYGIYHRGVYYVRNVYSHSELECSLPNYLAEAAEELLTLYTREEIRAKLDAIRARWLPAELGEMTDHAYADPDNSVQLAAVERHHETPHTGPVVTAAMDNELARRQTAEVRSRCLSDQVVVPQSPPPAVRLHRFQDVFASGRAMVFFNEDDPAVEPEPDRESLMFELTRFRRKLDTPHAAYIVDLDRNHLYRMINYEESNYANVLSRDHYVVRDPVGGGVVPSSLPHAHYPVLMEGGPEYGRSIEGAFFTTTPLVG